MFRGAGLGSVPKVEAALRSALRGLSFEDALAKLGEFGFEPSLDDQLSASERRFRLGGVELTVQREAIGLEPAVVCSIEDKLAKKKDRETFEFVSIGPAMLTRSAFDGIRARYEEEMTRFEEGLAARSKNAPLPTDLDALKSLGQAGQSAKKQKKEAAQAKEIQAALTKLTAQIEAMKAAGQAPKGIVVYVEGPDGAGKTSTGAIMIDALEATGYGSRVEVFKARTEAERKQHWLKRFERGVPKKGEVVFWDRGPAGDAVYGNPTLAKQRIMGKELVAFEKSLRDDGLLMFKLELHASPEKQAETFGKRLARQAMAHQIRGVLAARGELSPAKAEGLDAIAKKIDADDFRALEVYPEVQAGFERFVGMSEPKTWQVVDATKRHGARLSVVGQFSAALADYTPPKAGAQAA